MKLKHLSYALAAIVSSGGLMACTADSSASDPTSRTTGAVTYSSPSALPACDASIELQVAFVSDLGRFLVCHEGAWRELGAGVPGAKGADGANGTNGADGKAGKDGVNGKDGANGIDGVSGKDGANGIDGVSGKDGANGIDGVSGKDGANGVDGVNGKDGANGVDGVNGKDGANGIDGVNGKDGANGHSALVHMEDEPAGPNCKAGGVAITVGIDMNDNGKLDACEGKTSYVCNGQSAELPPPPPPSCGNLGESCCMGSLSCNSGALTCDLTNHCVPFIPACLPLGIMCMTSNDCCSGYCTMGSSPMFPTPMPFGTCQMFFSPEPQPEPPSESQCDYSKSCSSNADCCSAAVCENGRCSPI